MTYFVGIYVWQVPGGRENVDLLGSITELVSSERNTAYVDVYVCKCGLLMILRL